jgi:hypothetical protein
MKTSKKQATQRQQKATYIKQPTVKRKRRESHPNGKESKPNMKREHTESNNPTSKESY